MVVFWYGEASLLPGVAVLLPESGCCCRVIAKTGALSPRYYQIREFVAGILPKGVIPCRWVLNHE
jgi:hypothetical protein